jgi:hypothetical protein
MKKKYVRHEYSAGEIIKTRDGNDTKLTYIREGSKNVKRRVVVRCVCGREWESQLGNIVAGKAICCGKGSCRVPITKGDRDPEVGYKALLYVYKKHAKERGFEFHLTYDEFKILLTQNCHYCDSPPSQVYQLFKPGTREVRTGVPVTYNGIDRVDSKEHYTVDNTVTACKRCNVAKMDQSYEDFLKQVIKIYNNLKLEKWAHLYCTQEVPLKNMEEQ